MMKRNPMQTHGVIFFTKERNIMSNFIDNAKSFLGEHSSIILTSIAVAGVVGTAITASHDTLNAQKVLRQIEDENPDATKQEKLRELAPCYIPTLLMAGATIACVVGAHATNAQKIAAYASAYGLAQEAAGKYREKVKEIVGEEKSEEIDKEFASSIIENHTPGDREIMEIDDGRELCYDVVTGRWFQSDAETLRHIQNDLNHQLISEMWMSLNNFYYACGLAPVEIGEEIGWNSDHLIELRLTGALTQAGKPYLVVDFEDRPKAKYLNN